MFWYTAALRWCRNFTFLITFGLGGLWQMLYAPSGFHSTQILKEFILISGFWEEMAHTNTYRFLNPPPRFSPYPTWKSPTAPKASASHLNCSSSWVSVGSFLHLPLSWSCIAMHWCFLTYTCFLFQKKKWFWCICNAGFSLRQYVITQGRCTQGNHSFKLVNSSTLFRPSLICCVHQFVESLRTWL